MKKYDQFTGVVWFGLGIGITIKAIQLGLGKPRLPGPGFVAFLVGLSLGLSGFILALFATINKKSTDNQTQERGNWGRVIPVLLALFIFIFLLQPLGFLITTMLFSFVLFKMTEPKKCVIPALISLVVAFLSYLVFSVWLKIPFPKGFLSLG
jgi:putative tricarboxylic transport membrane protein